LTQLPFLQHAVKSQDQISKNINHTQNILEKVDLYSIDLLFVDVHPNIPTLPTEWKPRAKC